MKIQVAESIGLTENQVFGWFCHRRLKDKKFINGENHATGRQDRSSGVIQDQGSGLRQDSCSSTTQGDDRNFDNREVESGRFTPKEFSATEIIYEHDRRYPGNHNHTNDPSSGSSSSLQKYPLIKRITGIPVLARYLNTSLEWHHIQISIEQVIRCCEDVIFWTTTFTRGFNNRVVASQVIQMKFT